MKKIFLGMNAEHLTNLPDDVSDQSFLNSLDILKRENELNKLDAEACDINESYRLKEVNFADWFPTDLKNRLSDIASENNLGRAFRLVSLDSLNKYFSDINLKSYWKSINKNTKKFQDIDLAWAVSMPLYCYLLATHEKNRVNQLKASEFRKKSQLAAKKARELVELMGELDCDLNLLYLYLQSDEEGQKMEVDELNFLSESYSNKIYLSDVLSVFGTSVGLIADKYKYVLEMPNTKNPQETYFVKILCNFFLKMFNTPFHNHSMNLVNVLFEQTLTVENIRSKTKNIRRDNQKINFINDEFKVKGELLHSFLDEYHIEFYEQFYLNPLTVTDYIKTETSSIAVSYGKSFVAGLNYDIHYNNKDACILDWEKYLY